MKQYLIFDEDGYFVTSVCDVEQIRFYKKQGYQVEEQYS